MNGMFQKKYKNIKQLYQKFRQNINKPIFKRLSTRLLFTLTMLSAIPLFIVGLFMTSVTQESLSQYIKNRNNEIARRAGNEIKLFLDRPQKLISILLETKDIIDMNPFTQQLILNRVKSAYPFFNRIFIIDTIGNEITTSAFSQKVINYSVEDFFKRALFGESFTSDVSFNDDQEPFLISSYPIKKFNRIVGVLAGELDLKNIWDLVDEIKIENSGNAFVVDGNGRLIAHPDKKKIFDQTKVIEFNILNDVKEKSEQTIIYRSPEGEEMLGTFNYLSELDLVIVIQQPLDEAYGVVTRMLLQVFVFVGFVILIAVLLSYLLEKKITAPINTLINGVKKYGDGDLDYRIKIEKYEEISLLAEEFNAMAERLMENQLKLRRIERLAAVSKFATLVSHEIRNPLNSMNINMQILKREIESPRGDIHKKRKYFNILISEIRRMDNLINNFMMISRPPKIYFLPNDLHDILDEVMLMHTETAEQQGVKIIKKYSSKHSLAKVDRDQMKQVFHNIIINALQAMPQGGSLTLKTISKNFKSRSKHRRVAIVIEFIDTGIGIPADKLRDIFESYYTMKKTGTGLGLAIARQIVEGHAGIIEVTSKEGQGTRLIITLFQKMSSRSEKKNERVEME